MGSYFDTITNHGFLRDSDGTFTTFHAPNAATGFFAGTTPASINDSGNATGFYLVNALAGQVASGTLRSSNYRGVRRCSLFFS